MDWSNSDQPHWCAISYKALVSFQTVTVSKIFGSLEAILLWEAPVVVLNRLHDSSLHVSFTGKDDPLHLRWIGLRSMQEVLERLQRFGIYYHSWRSFLRGSPFWNHSIHGLRPPGYIILLVETCWDFSPKKTSPRWCPKCRNGTTASVLELTQVVLHRIQLVWQAIHSRSCGTRRLGRELSLHTTSHCTQFITLLICLGGSWLQCIWILFNPLNH